MQRNSNYKEGYHGWYQGDEIMMMEYITLAGFILTVFVIGVEVGRIVEKIEKIDRRKDEEK